ncbi:MAG: NRDE family protein [Deltaproteobacteria bacterium]
MCLILFAYKVHPAYQLILAANRDEFYERPSSPADLWEDEQGVLAGRDLQEGGTWMGIDRAGRFAAITNYRDPASLKNNAPSRGGLVSSYLCGDQRADDYLEEISRQDQLYNGYNLIVGDRRELFACSNRGEKQKLNPGIYGLSNHLLNTPWPKVTRGKKMLAVSLDKKGSELEDALFAMLADRKIPADNKLPDTGIGLEWERVLSSIFISSPVYGTRSSTILLIGKNGRIKFVEKVYDGQPQEWVTGSFSFLRERSIA